MSSLPCYTFSCSLEATVSPLLKLGESRNYVCFSSSLPPTLPQYHLLSLDETLSSFGLASPSLQFILALVLLLGYPVLRALTLPFRYSSCYSPSYYNSIIKQCCAACFTQFSLAPALQSDPLPRRP